jgi:hypothetical protein
LNQLRYDLRKLKGHGLLEREATHYAYRLTPKGFRSRYSSCFSTNDFAVPWPTADSTTSRTLTIAPTANWRLPTTKPTKLSKTSWIYWQPLELHVCYRPRMLK